jgi:hypothetical protein
MAGGCLSCCFPPFELIGVDEVGDPLPRAGRVSNSGPNVTQDCLRLISAGDGCAFGEIVVLTRSNESALDTLGADG